MATRTASFPSPSGRTRRTGWSGSVVRARRDDNGGHYSGRHLDLDTAKFCVRFARWLGPGSSARVST